LIEYFTGSISDEYIALKNLMALHNEKLSKLQTQRDLMNETFEVVKSNVSNTEFDFDTSDFREEIESLIEESEKLKVLEYKYKDLLLSLSEEKIVVVKQQKIIEATIHNLSK